MLIQFLSVIIFEKNNLKLKTEKKKKRGGWGIEKAAWLGKLPGLGCCITEWEPQEVCAAERCSPGALLQGSLGLRSVPRGTTATSGT